MTAAHPELDEQDELDVPPAVACARCGRTDCAGCADDASKATRPNPAPHALPWDEPEGRNVRGFWRTAEKTALDSRLVFGRIARDPLAPAWAFGALSEGLALLSLGLLGLLIFGALWPQQLAQWAQSRAFWIVAFGAWFFATSGMLLVHLVWGVCLEMGASWGGADADHRRGLRFAMYSTGWDLLTSPAGILLSFAFRGRVDFAMPITSAARTPRKAVEAYLLDCRRLDKAARKKAYALTIFVFSATLLLIVGGVIASLVFWIRAALS